MCVHLSSFELVILPTLPATTSSLLYHWLNMHKHDTEVLYFVNDEKIQNGPNIPCDPILYGIFYFF